MLFTFILSFSLYLVNKKGHLKFKCPYVCIRM
nr:MAG TPA: hypothetical protein [Caudoviricetes sp.]